MRRTVVITLAVLALGACGDHREHRTWVAKPTPAPEPAHAKPAPHRTASHPAHEHPHGAHPHASDAHHHHPHPHPHLDGPNGHHHPY
ncbi:MAG TPA: hypothetical protein VGM90_18685 [Kofleriaceae bacterium]